MRSKTLNRNDSYNNTEPDHESSPIFQQRPEYEIIIDDDRISQVFKEFDNVFKEIYGDIDQGRFQIPFFQTDEGIYIILFVWSFR